MKRCVLSAGDKGTGTASIWGSWPIFKMEGNTKFQFNIHKNENEIFSHPSVQTTCGFYLPNALDTGIPELEMHQAPFVSS